MDIITYAILKKLISNSFSSAIKEEIIVNENGELEIITSLPSININMDTGYLESNSDVFSVKNGYLVSEVQNHTRSLA